MRREEFKERLLDALLYNNPVVVQLLGMCSTLAVTTSVVNGIAMGITTTLVLTATNLIISLFRNIIPKQIRIASYIVLIAGFVTAVEMLVGAYLPAISKSLGIFIPLITVNCIILARAEAFASKNKPLPSVVDGFVMGLGFTAALVALSLFREFFGHGTIAGISVLGKDFEGASLIAMPAGGFLTLGTLIATLRYFLDKPKKKTVVQTEIAKQSHCLVEKS